MIASPGVAQPLREVLFLVVCGRIANCHGWEDIDDIADRGEAHIALLRRFCDVHLGIACLAWLRSVVNRIDPALLARPFGLDLAGQAGDKRAIKRR